MKIYKSPLDQAIDLNKEGLKSDKMQDFLEGFSLDNWHLSKREKDAIENYTTLSNEINPYLRGQTTKQRDDVDEDVAALDSAISRFELPYDLRVYRASDDSLIKGKKIGDIVEDKAFVSTSPYKGPVEDFRKKWGGGSKLTYIINVPKGKGRGAYLPYYSHQGFSEDEFLLGRNNKFKINNIDGNKVFLDMVI